MSRVIGSNSHGNKNELRLVEEIDNKHYLQLNNNLKEFIRFIANDNNMDLSDNPVLHANYEPNTKLKQDLYIEINKHTFSISLKMGSGKSVQEIKLEIY